MWYVAAVLLCTPLLASGKLNYCGSRMCSYTNAHTFCQFPDGPGPQCIGYVETPLTTEEKIRLVIRLNQRRAAVASGRLRGFPTAGNMMKVLWIEELAREAQLWADQCEPPSTPEENDACRDLYSVSIGQCVASVIGEAPGLRPESMVDIWYMQSMFYKGNVTSYEAPVNNRYNYYGDFAQLIYSKTYMVGCGRSRFMVLMSGRLRSVERLVCNFAPRGPSSGRSLWTVASPGSACPPRTLPDDNVPALCTVQHDLNETHDQDSSMSLQEHILLETVFQVEKNESLNYLGSLDEIFLTKVAVATIGDDATTPAAFNTLQKQYNNMFESINNEISNKTDKNNSAETYKQKEKVVLVGRPKSYNIEELNEGDVQLNNDNPDTQMQDLPIKDTHFDVDYEFSDRSDPRRIASAEMSTADTVGSATAPSIVTTFENINSPSSATSVLNSIIEEIASLSTLGATPHNTDLINNISKYNLTMGENETDALLEEYLSDPETVKRLQEELYRMEQAMLTATTKVQTQTTPFERAEKVRRALKDGRVTYSNRDQLLDNTSLENSTRHVPQFLQMFSDNENKSLPNPVMSMAMRYMPYLRDYNSGIMKTAFANSNRNTVSYYCTIIIESFLLFNVL